jgi:hypothetical protein
MRPLVALLVALATAGAGLFAVDRGLAWYAPRHFIPEARMRAALARGDDCVVLAGDSRMVAGYDEAAFSSALGAAGRNDCLATIAIGALRVQGLALAIREYFERGGKPRLLVLGTAEDTLLPPDPPLDPSAFIGNEAILLAWSEPSDVARLYPGFPLQSVRAFDQGVRFAWARSTGLGTYLSLVWQPIQAYQDRLTGQARARNVFGALSDMEASGRRMVKEARGLLARALARPEAERLAPDFELILRTTAAAGARLAVVELPMPAAYREAVTNSPEGRRYLTWLRDYLARRGAVLVDLTHPEWLAADQFSDFVHLNERGAAAFSHDLGRAIGELPAIPRPR